MHGFIIIIIFFRGRHNHYINYNYMTSSYIIYNYNTLSGILKSAAVLVSIYSIYQLIPLLNIDFNIFNQDIFISTILIKT